MDPVAFPQSAEGDSVQAISVPASIKDVAIIWDASSLGSPLNYPAEGTLWQNVSYNLYKTTALSNEQWTVLLIPKASMNVGDTFTIRVNYTGGSYQDFFITTSYVLTDWSKIVSYNSTTMPTHISPMISISSGPGIPMKAQGFMVGSVGITI